MTCSHCRRAETQGGASCGSWAQGVAGSNPVVPTKSLRGVTPGNSPDATSRVDSGQFRSAVHVGSVLLDWPLEGVRLGSEDVGEGCHRAREARHRFDSPSRHLGADDPRHFTNRRSPGYNGVDMEFKRITTNPRQMGGVPCLRGLRIPVATVVALVAEGHTAEDILALYPDLEADDVREALLFAAEAVRERALPLAAGE